jgi:hypothetical protein
VQVVDASDLLTGRRRAAMRDAIRRALDALPDLRRRVVVDVDPMSVLQSVSEPDPAARAAPGDSPD